MRQYICINDQDYLIRKIGRTHYGQTEILLSKPNSQPIERSITLPDWWLKDTNSSLKILFSGVKVGSSALETH